MFIHNSMESLMGELEMKQDDPEIRKINDVISGLVKSVVITRKVRDYSGQGGNGKLRTMYFTVSMVNGKVASNASWISPQRLIIH